MIWAGKYMVCYEALLQSGYVFLYSFRRLNPRLFSLCLFRALKIVYIRLHVSARQTGVQFFHVPFFADRTTAGRPCTIRRIRPIRSKWCHVSL